MSRARADVAEEDDLRHPRDTEVLFGHDAAERTLLDAYKSGRIPHAFLIGGPQGIGKATLAFRMARFVLANPDPATDAVQHATSLAVARGNPAAELVRAQSHPDLLVLERSVGDNGKLRSVIRVEDARQVTGFLSTTAGLGGWRVVIVDAVDDLNAESANALLKGLEEPPARTLFLLVSHAPGSVLATIRSRCHRLMLRPLERKALVQALSAAGQEVPEDAVLQAAEGSVSGAMALSEGPAFKLRQQAATLLAQLPKTDPRELHALADAMAGSDPRQLEIVLDAINDWLSGRLRAFEDNARRAAHIAEIWSEVNAAARSTDIYNLDRKPLIFRAFGRLAEAAGD